MIERKDKIKTNTSIFAGTSFALLATTCCALPIALVSVGLGGAVASMFSTLPWLAKFGQYKVWTFSITGVMLAYCWFALHQLGNKMAAEGASCSIGDRKMLKWQKRILWISTILLGVSIFAAYAALPIRIWIDDTFGL